MPNAAGPGRAPLSPPLGEMRGAAHALAVRVYYEDTDALGFVYYANYLKFIERGRTDLLRLAGITRSDAAGGCLFAVHSLSAEFLSPARLDDALIVWTRLKRLGGASLDLDQEVERDGETIVRARVRAVSIGRDGRVRRLPSRARETFRTLLQQTNERQLS